MNVDTYEETGNRIRGETEKERRRDRIRKRERQESAGERVRINYMLIKLIV